MGEEASNQLQAVVTVRDLRMRYGDNDVLNGVEFDVHSGEVLCLLGPNGAGKTTTIEILEGFRIRSAGAVSVLGTGPRERGRGLAGPHGRGSPVVARPPALDAPSAADAPRGLLRAVLHGTTTQTARCRLLLDTVGLTELADRKIATLRVASGGGSTSP